MPNVEAAFLNLLRADFRYLESTGYRKANRSRVILFGSRNPLQSIKNLFRPLPDGHFQSGLHDCWAMGELPRSFEARALQPEFHALFTTAELAEAQRRLDALTTVGSPSDALAAFIRTGI